MTYYNLTKIYFLLTVYNSKQHIFFWKQYVFLRIIAVHVMKCVALSLPYLSTGLLAAHS